MRRNKSYFIASVVTIAACIFLMGLFLSIAMNFVSAVGQAEDEISITVFFDEGTDESQILEIQSEIESWDEVASTVYTSAEEAWENFKDSYFEDYPDLAEGFENDNPLADSASIDVYMSDITLQDELSERLEALDGVRQVNRSETTASALSDIGKIVAAVSGILIIVLLAVSIFLISNTIAMGINARKDEIQIMKYVGATDFFVSSPFIFEGIFIGIIGAAIPVLIILIIYRSAAGYFIAEFQAISSSFTLLGTGQIFVVFVPVAVVIGAGIGVVGSLISTKRYIKV